MVVACGQAGRARKERAGGEAQAGEGGGDGGMVGHKDRWYAGGEVRAAGVGCSSEEGVRRNDGRTQGGETGEEEGD